MSRLLLEITRCLACGDDLPVKNRLTGERSFPHLCDRCIESERLTGRLPGDVEHSVQTRIDEVLGDAGLNDGSQDGFLLECIPSFPSASCGLSSLVTRPPYQDHIGVDEE